MSPRALVAVLEYVLELAAPVAKAAAARLYLRLFAFPGAGAHGVHSDAVLRLTVALVHTAGDTGEVIALLFMPGRQ